VAWNPFRRKTGVERGHGETAAPPPVIDPHASDDERAASWRELATLITPDAGLSDVVLLAHRSPAEYLRVHADDAENRGLEDEDVDPWFALVDWLIENEFAHELDWRENAAELAWGLSRMSAVLASGIDLQSVDDADAHLTFGVLRANALLAPAGLELVIFDIDSDSFPVVLVETTNRDRIVALAAGLGHRVDVVTLERARREGGRGYADDIEL
jgi:rhodanese-related sulfurtransferase